MVVINFHHFQRISSVIAEEDSVGQHDCPHIHFHGSLASGEWLHTSTDSRQGKIKEKSSKSTSSKKCNLNKKQIKIEFDVSGSPQAIYVREKECDEWSVSTLGIDSSLKNMRIAVSTPILSGGF